MIRISLTQDEEYLLTAYFKKSPIELIRSKSLAIRMRSEGVKIKEISKYIGRSGRTITGGQKISPKEEWLVSLAGR